MCIFLFALLGLSAVGGEALPFGYRAPFFAQAAVSVQPHHGLAPPPSVDPYVAVYGDTLLVLAGPVSTTDSTLVFEYMFAEQRWVHVPVSGTPPPARHGRCVVRIGNILYIVGGESALNALAADVYEYQMDARRWVLHPARGTDAPPSVGVRTVCFPARDVVLLWNTEHTRQGTLQGSMYEWNPFGNSWTLLPTFVPLPPPSGVSVADSGAFVFIYAPGVGTRWLTVGNARPVVAADTWSDVIRYVKPTRVFSPTQVGKSPWVSVLGRDTTASSFERGGWFEVGTFRKGTDAPPPRSDALLMLSSGRLVLAGGRGNGCMLGGLSQDRRGTLGVSNNVSFTHVGMGDGGALCGDSWSLGVVPEEEKDHVPNSLLWTEILPRGSAPHAVAVGTNLNDVAPMGPLAPLGVAACGGRYGMQPSATVVWVSGGVGWVERYGEGQSAVPAVVGRVVGVSRDGAVAIAGGEPVVGSSSSSTTTGGDVGATAAPLGAVGVEVQLPAVHGHSAISVRRMIVVYGGYTSVGAGGISTLSSDIFVAAVDGQHTASKAPLSSTLRWQVLSVSEGGGVLVPSPRAFHSAVAIGATMYAFGGMTAVGPTNELWMFSFLEMRWWAVSSREAEVWPAPRAEHAAAVKGHKMYVFGGRGVRHARLLDSSLWVFDIRFRRWTALDAGADGDVPPGSLGATLAVVGDGDDEELIVIGGEGEDGTEMLVYRYHILRRRWRQVVLDVGLNNLLGRGRGSPRVVVGATPSGWRAAHALMLKRLEAAGFTSLARVTNVSGFTLSARVAVDLVLTQAVASGGRASNATPSDVVGTTEGESAVLPPAWVGVFGAPDGNAISRWAVGPTSLDSGYDGTATSVAFGLDVNREAVSDPPTLSSPVNGNAPEIVYWPTGADEDAPDVPPLLTHSAVVVQGSSMYIVGGLRKYLTPGFADLPTSSVWRISAAPCPAYTASTADASRFDCVPCGPGTYVGVVEGKRSCIPCPSGMWSSTFGALACAPCARGFHAPALGYVTGEGARDEAECIPCFAGSFNPVSGQSKCLPCADSGLCPVGAIVDVGAAASSERARVAATAASEVAPSCLLRTPMSDSWLVGSSGALRTFQCDRYEGAVPFGGTAVECESAYRTLAGYARVSSGLSARPTATSVATEIACVNVPTLHVDEYVEVGREWARWLRWISIVAVGCALLVGLVSELVPSVRSTSVGVAVTRCDIFFRGRSSFCGAIWSAAFIILTVPLLLNVALPWLMGSAVEQQSLVPDLLESTNLVDSFVVGSFGNAATSAAVVGQALVHSGGPSSDSLVTPISGPVRASLQWELDVFGLVVSCSNCSGVAVSVSLAANDTERCQVACAYNEEARLCRVRSVCDAVALFHSSSAAVTVDFTHPDAYAHLIAMRVALSSHYPGQETSHTVVAQPAAGEVFRGVDRTVLTASCTPGVWRSEWNGSMPRSGQVVVLNGVDTGSTVGPSAFVQTSGLGVELVLQRESLVHSTVLSRRFATPLIAITLIGFFSGISFHLSTF